MGAPQPESEVSSARPWSVTAVVGHVAGYSCVDVLMTHFRGLVVVMVVVAAVVVVVVGGGSGDHEGQ